ncbi:DUF4154 domain-containing protein [bacterium]|nr:DUF4154 domain-containing protein [bacterium]
MKRLFISILLTCIGISASSFPVAFGQDREAPPYVAAALIIKLAAFETNISGSDSVSIYVLGESDITEELKKGIGQAIGSATLARVEGGNTLPLEKPSILVIGANTKADMGMEYSRQYKVLSMAGNIDLVDRGVTLGFGVGGNGKPVIRLNLTSTVLENVSWNPAIMKLAKTVK